MLALPPSVPSPREQRAPPSMTTSLAILPQRLPARPSQPPPRPKLSLNTQQTRLFGKGSSLRLETLSAVSPTVRNTFSNAYEAPAPAPAPTPTPLSAAPALGRPSKPRLSIDSSVPSQAASGAVSALQIDTSTPTSSVPTSASTLHSGSTSASSTDSAALKVPYKLSHNLRSILSNSPAQSIRPRKMAPYRPFFPATKKVAFATPLEEEITTSTYTMAHSDIEISSSSTLSLESTTSTSSSSSSSREASSSSKSNTLSPSPSTSTLSLSISTCTTNSDTSTTPSLSPSASPPSESSSPHAFSSTESPLSVRAPRTGEKRDSSSSEESDSEDSCPETPVAGRRKRRREWVWTLGPIGKSSSSSEQTLSDDSS